MNKVILLGHLGKGLYNKGNITKFTLATKEGEKTQFVPITAFDLKEEQKALLKEGVSVLIHKAKVTQTNFVKKNSGETIYTTQVTTNKDGLIIFNAVA